jgi:hypothetical protein
MNLSLHASFPLGLGLLTGAALYQAGRWALLRGLRAYRARRQHQPHPDSHALRFGGHSLATLKSACPECRDTPARFCPACTQAARLAAVKGYVEGSAIPRLLAGLEKNPKARAVWAQGPRSAMGYVIDLLRGVGEQPEKGKPAPPGPVEAGH